MFKLSGVADAGMDTLIFVIGRNKFAIEDLFASNQELEMAFRAKIEILLDM